MGWGEIVSRIAEGNDPQAFAQARKLREEKISEEQRRRLLDAREGRNVDEFNTQQEKARYDVSQRGTQEKEAELRNAGYDLANQRTQKQIEEDARKADVFAASGGAQGAADREVGKYNQDLAESRSRINTLAAHLKLDISADERARLQNELILEHQKLANAEQQATSPDRIQQSHDAVDPEIKDNAMLNSYSNVLRNTAQEAPGRAEMEQLALDLMKEAALKKKERASQRRGGQKPVSQSPTAPKRGNVLTSGPAMNRIGDAVMDTAGAGVGYWKDKLGGLLGL